MSKNAGGVDSAMVKHDLKASLRTPERLNKRELNNAYVCACTVYRPHFRHGELVSRLMDHGAWTTRCKYGGGGKERKEGRAALGLDA